MHYEWAVTANHCVKRIAIGDALVLSDIGGTSYTGTLWSRDDQRDVALIRILEPRYGTVTPPIASGTENCHWKSPCRPSLRDPQLSGEVSVAAAAFKCKAGATVTALQLISHQELNDFSGYSGSPIQQGLAEADTTLVGLLIEQHPNPTDATKATNVIWALGIFEMVQVFGPELQEALLRKLEFDKESERRKIINSRVQRAALDLGYAYDAIDEVETRHRINPAALSVMRAYLPKEFLGFEDVGLNDED